MAANLTPAQREEYGARAWEMSLRGHSSPQIARTFGISEKAVDRLLKHEREKAAKARESERERLLARFEGEQDAVIADAWERLDQIDANARTAPDLQANILTASANKAKANGLLTDKPPANALSLDLAADLKSITITLDYGDR